MKLIDKHLLRELLIPLCYCLVGFAMVLLIGEMFGDIDRILSARPGWLLVVRFYVSILGPMLQYLMPASLMLATLYTLYGLTRNNELVAMRASGISIYRLMLPFVFVGFILSIAVAVVGDLWVPHAFEWAQDIKSNKFNIGTTNTIQRCIYLNPEAQRQWIITELDPKKPHILHGVEVKQESTEGHRLYVITAARAEFLDQQWWFFNPYIQRFGLTDNPIGQPTLMGVGEHSVVEMPEFDETPEAFVSAVRKWEHLNMREMYHYLRTHPGMAERALNEKRFSLHDRLAMPWACLIVVFFAIPAGARTGRQGVLSAVFAAIALMAGFYTLAQIGRIIGSLGVIPPWTGAWLSNMVFGMVGIVLLKRLH
ncbi:MAG TPA: hypothetical protein DCS43_14530 [Verrucomicrobia bacterium]|nr:hypothetical protein [Verrucomicrobiota bacterium]